MSILHDMILILAGKILRRLLFFIPIVYMRIYEYAAPSMAVICLSSSKEDIATRSSNDDSSSVKFVIANDERDDVIFSV